MEMRNRVVVITGGTAGIGKATARRFVEEGATVAIIGRSDDAGRTVEAELTALANARGEGGCSYFHADVGKNDEVQAAVTAIAAKWRAVHVLVNNAALMKTGPLVGMAESDWEETVAVNMRAPFLFAKYALPLMPEGSAIINISSVHAIATDAGSTLYSASKGWLEAFTRGLSLECHARGIRVNALRVGAVDTKMLWDNPLVKSGAEEIDRREVADPAEIAEAVLFLASRRSSFVSGTVLSADGGRLPILGSHASLSPGA